MISLLLLHGLLCAILMPLIRADTASCRDSGRHSDGDFDIEGAFEVSSQADADALSHCTEILGTISVASDTLETLTLHGIQNISEVLLVTNAPQLRELSAPNLSSTGSFGLWDLPRLSVVDVPLLTEITRNLNWTNLPALQNASFPANISQATLTVSEITAILNVSENNSLLSITNTSISSLEGFNFTSVSYVDISGNHQLKTINLPDARDVRYLKIADNYPGASIYLPAFNASRWTLISNASSLYAPEWQGGCSSSCEFSGNTFTNMTSTFRLSVIIGNLTIKHNPFLSEISLPYLTNASELRIEENPLLLNVTLENAKTVGTLAINRNPLLEHLTLPSLSDVYGFEHIGDGYSWFDGYFEGLMVQGNDNLKSLSLPKMAVLKSPVTLWGNFSSVEFPTLNTIDENFGLNTTFADFDCSPFDLLFHNTWGWNGDDTDFYYCKASAPGSTVDTALHASPPPDPSKGFHLSRDSKIGIGLGSGVAGFAILFVVGYFIKKRLAKRRPVRRRSLDRTATGRVEAGEALNDLPPVYKPVGEAGEVPPGYEGDESEPVSHQESAEVGDDGHSDGHHGDGHEDVHRDGLGADEAARDVNNVTGPLPPSGT